MATDIHTGEWSWVVAALVILRNDGIEVAAALEEAKRRVAASAFASPRGAMELETPVQPPPSPVTLAESSIASHAAAVRSESLSAMLVARASAPREDSKRATSVPPNAYVSRKEALKRRLQPEEPLIGFTRDAAPAFGTSVGLIRAWHSKANGASGAKDGAPLHLRVVKKPILVDNVLMAQLHDGEFVVLAAFSSGRSMETVETEVVSGSLIKVLPADCTLIRETQEWKGATGIAAVSRVVIRDFQVIDVPPLVGGQFPCFRVVDLRDGLQRPVAPAAAAGGGDDEPDNSGAAAVHDGKDKESSDGSTEGNGGDDGDGGGSGGGGGDDDVAEWSYMQDTGQGAQQRTVRCARGRLCSTRGNYFRLCVTLGISGEDLEQMAACNVHVDRECQEQLSLGTLGDNRPNAARHICYTWQALNIFCYRGGRGMLPPCCVAMVRSLYPSKDHTYSSVLSKHYDERYGGSDSDDGPVAEDGDGEEGDDEEEEEGDGDGSS